MPARPRSERGGGSFSGLSFFLLFGEHKRRRNTWEKGREKAERAPVLTFFPPESATTSSVCLDLDLALPLFAAASAAKAANRSVHRSGTSEASRNEASGKARRGGEVFRGAAPFSSSFLSSSSSSPALVFPMIESRSCLIWNFVLRGERQREGVRERGRPPSSLLLPLLLLLLRTAEGFGRSSAACDALFSPLFSFCFSLSLSVLFLSGTHLTFSTSLKSHTRSFPGRGESGRSMARERFEF